MPADQPTIYCINLARSGGRRVRMERRLSHHGLLERTRFIPGVEPSPGGVEDAQRRASTACFRSHLSALRALLAETAEADGAIVCEDDVLLHNDWHPRLGRVLSNLPHDAPLCALGYLVGGWHGGFTWAGRDPLLRNLCDIVPDEIWGTQMYWISRTYAEQVLTRFDRGEAPAWAEPIVRDSEGYLCYPPLALEDAVDSTIRGADELEGHVRSLALWRYRDYSDCEDGVDVSPLSRRPAPSLALCMIVRNEQEVIGRCIASARPLIDTWVICDTGSTDRTRERIREAMHGLPGELHDRPWHDFAHNRSELLELARGKADYLLLLDADQTLARHEPLPDLVEDAYLVRHEDLGLDYAVPHLIRGSRRWWYESPAHEYLATEGRYSRATLTSLVVHHHADGGTRSGRLAWDAEVLERELSLDPGNQRATFYLAQTYRDLGEEERALELYRRRVELGGWDQEVFYAAYQAAAIVARSRPDDALPLLFDAWQLRPTRAEPLYELARLSRLAGRYEAAYAFAQQGLEIEYPDDIHFVHRFVYEWGLLSEFAMAAYWVGKLDQAEEANDRLLGDERLPAEVRRIARANQRLCAEGLGRRARRGAAAGLRLQDLAPSMELGEIRLDVDPRWPQFNPTIAADGDGLRMIVRTANYRLRDGVYRILDDDGVIRNIHYVARLDSALRLQEVLPLQPPEDGVRTYPVRVRGYEDCRLTRVEDRWLVLATARDRNREERCEMLLLTLRGPNVAEELLLPGPEPGRHEKNWMPFVEGGEIHFVYSCGPTVVAALDSRSGPMRIVSRHETRRDMGSLRGGSQGVSVEQGTLFVVHEVVAAMAGRRYTHRFVLLNEAYRLVAMSPRFSFAHEGVEFCAGLAGHGSKLVLSFGIGDAAAGLAVIDTDDALASLGPLDVAQTGV